MIKEKVEEITHYQIENQRLQEKLKEAQNQLAILKTNGDARTEINNTDKGKEALGSKLKTKEKDVEMLNEEIIDLKKQLTSLNQMISKYGDVKSQCTILEELLKAKEMIVDTLNNEIEAQTNKMEEYKKSIESLINENKELREKHTSGISTTNKFISQYYPVREVKQKEKIFTNLRFIKNHFNEYGLEKYNLKERLALPLKSIEITIHKKMEDCIIVKQKTKPSKTEIYEGEFVKDIIELYNKYSN